MLDGVVFYLAGWLLGVPFTWHSVLGWLSISCVCRRSGGGWWSSQESGGRWRPLTCLWCHHREGVGVKWIPTYSMRPDQMYPEVSRNTGKSQNCTRWTQKKKNLPYHSVISGDPGGAPVTKNPDSHPRHGALTEVMGRPSDAGPQAHLSRSHRNFSVSSLTLEMRMPPLTTKRGP